MRGFFERLRTADLDPSQYMGDMWQWESKDSKTAPRLELVAPYTLMASRCHRVKALSTSPSTLKVADAESLIMVTTGASAFTLNLFDLTLLPDGICLTICKADAGAGELIIDPYSTQTINGYTTLRLMKQYQKMSVISYGGNWIIEHGPLQPVAGEPDSGGGWHNLLAPGAGIKITYAPADANTFYTQTAFTEAADGAVAVIAYVQSAAVGAIYSRKAGSSAAANYETELFYAPTAPFGVECILWLDSSKQTQIAASFSGANITIGHPKAYLLGPV